MIITVTAFKGGVGKTTTAIHLAHYFNQLAPTILIDGDLNRSAKLWSAKGNLAFTVVDEREGIKAARNFEHIIIDTPARPEQEEIQSLARGCDLLLVPTTPDVLAMGALNANIQTFKQLNIQNFQVIVTIVPPRPSTVGKEARDFLKQAGFPVLNQMVRRLAVYQKSALAGTVVSDVKGDRSGKNAWKDYETIGEQIYGKIKN